MAQELKDRNGHLIGKIVEEGGKLVIKDRNGHSKGKYDPKTNTTYNMNGPVSYTHLTLPTKRIV